MLPRSNAEREVGQAGATGTRSSLLGSHLAWL